MVDNKNKIEEEKEIVKTMIELYCKNHHSPSHLLCDECQCLLEYSQQQLENCLFGEEKPFCSKCPVHCYRSDMREKIREVMRYAGPRMIFTDASMALRHLLARFRKTPPIPKKTTSQ